MKVLYASKIPPRKIALVNTKSILKTFLQRQETAPPCLFPVCLKDSFIKAELITDYILAGSILRIEP